MANSMCFARTAALQGGYEKQKVTASRDFLQQLLQKCVAHGGQEQKR